MTFLLEDSLEAFFCARNLPVKLERSDMVAKWVQGKQSSETYYGNTIN